MMNVFSKFAGDKIIVQTSITPTTHIMLYNIILQQKEPGLPREMFDSKTRQERDKRIIERSIVPEGKKLLARMTTLH